MPWWRNASREVDLMGLLVAKQAQRPQVVQGRTDMSRSKEIRFPGNTTALGVRRGEVEEQK